MSFQHPAIRLCRLAAALLLVSAGCGESDRESVFPVSGSVTVNGKKPKDAVVSFHPADELHNPRALRSMATTEKDGTFRLTTYMSHDGAPEGEYVVTVYWPAPLPRDAHPGDVGADLLKGRYANPKTSPLRATVGKGENALAPFKLSAR
jgi:hypothetical protein